MGFELNPSESIAGHVRSAGCQRARIRKLIIFQRFLRFLEIQDLDVYRLASEFCRVQQSIGCLVLESNFLSRFFKPSSD